jgi:hypothetical protein
MINQDSVQFTCIAVGIALVILAIWGLPWCIIFKSLRATKKENKEKIKKEAP